MWSSLGQLEQKFGEGLARSCEWGGSSPLSSRLFALLVFSTKPLSLNEMAEQLGVTKAAVSVRIRALEQQGLCIKTSHLSDRRDYYHLAEDAGMVTLQNGLNSMRSLTHFLGQMLAEWPEDDPAAQTAEGRTVKRRLLEMKALYDLMFAYLEKLENEWHVQKQQLAEELEP
ncbi:MAG: MarR family transcriptional regulator [Brevibacillus sp.]|nr:MarR family transcriptional regulator [Brevibacillus sp.]